PPQRVAEYVLGNTKKPGKRRRSVPIVEPASAKPGPCEDFGCQVGGMLANPWPRPGKHLTDVPVIHLRECIGITRSQEFRVRRPSEVASHNLYFAAPQKSVSASTSLSGSTRPWTPACASVRDCHPKRWGCLPRSGCRMSGDDGEVAVVPPKGGLKGSPGAASRGGRRPRSTGPAGVAR